MKRFQFESRYKSFFAEVLTQNSKGSLTLTFVLSLLRTFFNFPFQKFFCVNFEIRHQKKKMSWTVENFPSQKARQKAWWMIEMSHFHNEINTDEKKKSCYWYPRIKATGRRQWKCCVYQRWNKHVSWNATLSNYLIFSRSYTHVDIMSDDSSFIDLFFFLFYLIFILWFSLKRPKRIKRWHLSRVCFFWCFSFKRKRKRNFWFFDTILHFSNWFLLEENQIFIEKLIFKGFFGTFLEAQTVWIYFRFHLIIDPIRFYV